MATSSTTQEDIDFALMTARIAGNNTLKWFRKVDLVVDSKNDGSPVTEADRTTEELVRKLINEKFPGDGIVGEEFDQDKGSTGRIWTIDPIHGTLSFTCGIPSYATLLALGTQDEDGSWDLGVAYIPALDEMIYAYRGGGCWFVDSSGNQSQAHTSRTKNLKEAKLTATGANYVPPEIIKGADIFRTWGDGYGYLLLATGQVDAMLEIGLSVWDFAPFQVIVEEAGGKFLEWKRGGDGRATELLEVKCTDRVSTNGTLDLSEHLDLNEAPIFMV